MQIDWLPSFFFATSICIQDMHFHPTARKLYLNKLTLTVCLRNARTTYFIFRNDYLQPLQEGLKEEKEKKTRSSQKKKLSHQAHDVKITSYWHQCIVVTSHWRQYDVILTSYTCWNVIKKSQSPTAHDVLLTSMRRDYVASMSIQRHFAILTVCHAWASKAVN